MVASCWASWIQMLVCHSVLECEDPPPSLKPKLCQTALIDITETK